MHKQTQRRSVRLAADKINTGAKTARMILIRCLAPTAKYTDERQFQPTCFPQFRMHHENNSKPNISNCRQNTVARAWLRPARCEPSQESGSIATSSLVSACLTVGANMARISMLARSHWPSLTY